MITLVLGGARSGKSAVAEAIVGRARGPVTYVATGRVDPGDDDMAARVEAHRARRPAAWSTLEVGPGRDLADTLAGARGTVLVDSLGTWVAAHRDLAVDLDAVLAALALATADVVLVSDETGLGVHPSSELGRRFRDVLGEVNRRIAEVADHVLLVVAGRVLRLEAFDPDALDPDALDPDALDPGSCGPAVSGADPP